MQTTGPYTPVAGTPITVYDPARYTAGDVAVQVQNNSSMIVTCEVAGRSLPVPPYIAATLPTFQSPQLVMTPTNAIGTGSGSILLVWLQDGEEPPIVDGPLVGNTQVLS